MVNQSLRMIILQSKWVKRNTEPVGLCFWIVVALGAEGIAIGYSFR